MRSESPSPSWYEPADLIEDDTDTPEWPHEALTATQGVIWWSSALIDTDAD